MAGDNVRTKPTECGLAIALPLERQEFFADLEPGSQKDFALAWMGQHGGWSAESVWQDYERYARFALDVAREAGRRGVRVCLRASLDEWQGLVRERSVVTLFAHWCTGSKEHPGDRVEFADCLHTIPDVVEAIPEGYDGVLDFTICRSLTLAPAVKSRHPQCTVVVNKRAARVDYRLAIFRQALRLLATGEYSYVDALAEVHLSILENAKMARHSGGQR